MPQALNPDRHSPDTHHSTTLKAEQIATLLNQILKPEGIVAKVQLKQNHLGVMLEGSMDPDPRILIPLIENPLQSLDRGSVQTVKLFGKRQGQDFPAWEKTLNLQARHSDQPKTSEILPLHRLVPMVIASLGIRILFESLFLLYSLVWATSVFAYDLVDAVDVTGVMAQGLFYLVNWIDAIYYPLETVTGWSIFVSALLIAIWLHRSHASLRTILPNYPIRPWGAIAYFLLPFYNIVGIWKLFTTLGKSLGKYLKTSSETELNKLEHILKLYLYIFYPCWFLSGVMNLMYWFQEGQGYGDDLSPVFFVFSNGFALVIAILWFLLVRTCQKAVVRTVQNLQKTAQKTIQKKPINLVDR